MICPLCSHNATIFLRDQKRSFYKCPECQGIFVGTNSLPSAIEEENRYHLHNYKEKDSGYLNFVSPLIKAVKTNHAKDNIGLDYGCGKVPMLANHLTKQGYTLYLYDPFFHKNEDVFNKLYDYIICCEVIEHFHKPYEQFKILKSLLNTSGVLYCKTELQPKQEKFKSWWYKNDTTHTFFYSEQTLHWIKTKFNFSNLRITSDYIIFKV